MTPREIEAYYARQYKFRPRGPQETSDRYRAALVAHVQVRDWSAAEEVRIGKLQADWTQADVAAFRASLAARPHPSIGPPPPVVPTIHAGTIPLGDQATIDALLLDMARHGLAHLVESRTQTPERELVIMLTMVLANGEIHIAPSPRGSRLSILKAFARDHALLGFNVGADVFIHSIDNVGEPGEQARKTDAIMMHVGTHTSRWLFVRPYTIRNGVAIFRDPPPPDRNLRDLPPGETMIDPYAEILCSVPLPTGRPS